MIRISMTICLILLICAPLYALDKNGNFESREEQDKYVSLTLKEMAREFNNQTPIIIDSETQINSVLVLGKTINFNGRLINLSSKQVDKDVLRKYVWKNVNDIACNNKATRDLIDLGVSYVYIYFGNDDRLITRVVLDKYYCK